MARKPKKVTIPNDWKPREYQWPLWKFMVNGGKRAAVVWARRHGKDSVSINWTATAAHLRKGVYWHMLPTMKQGRKVIWDSIDKQGRRVIDQAFPEEIRTSTNSQEMRIELKCGSIWQVVGSDNYDSLIGANPVGVVFSEYSVADPAAWRFLSPILGENEGWAIFIYTPRGKNHGYKLFRNAQKIDRWFSELLTLTDSNAYPMSVVDEVREEGEDEAVIQQEYFCSFDAAVAGAYYGKALVALEKAGRRREVPYDAALQVITAWDLGMDDSTVIWFIQLVNAEIRVIDYYASRGQGLEHYAKVLKEKPYVYADHLLPHDAKVRELGTGKSRQEVLEALLDQYITVVPRQSVEDGIQAVRTILSRCFFDMEKTDDAFEALTLYRSEWDEKTRLYKPVHDWTSHPADGLRTFATGFQEIRVAKARQITAQMDYNPLHYNEQVLNQQSLAIDYNPLGMK